MNPRVVIAIIALVTTPANKPKDMEIDALLTESRRLAACEAAVNVFKAALDADPSVDCDARLKLCWETVRACATYPAAPEKHK